MFTNSLRDRDLPTISIIMVTRNVERTLRRALVSIVMQDYPKSKLKLLVVDGGSKDATLSILKESKFPIKIIQGKYPYDQEARRGIGLSFAKGEIVAYIDADNYLPHSLWLRNMVIPFLLHPEVIGTFTLRYGYRKEDSVLNRYFALLGSADPVDYYLRKGERLSFLFDTWNRYGDIIAKYKDYLLVKFDPQYFPTLGANGFLARRKLWQKGNADPSRYVHVDVAYDLSKMGYTIYGIVNDEIIHDTAASFLSFLKKRISYITLYRQSARSRSYKVFDPGRRDDVLNLAAFIFFSLTFLQPLILAVRGYLKKQDFAWFIHPFFCLTVVVMYTSALIFSFVQDRLRKLHV